MFKQFSGCLSLVLFIIVLQIALPKEILELSKEVMINFLGIINQALLQLKN